MPYPVLFYLGCIILGLVATFRPLWLAYLMLCMLLSLLAGMTWYLFYLLIYWLCGKDPRWP
jgi:hypothetical protein